MRSITKVVYVVDELLDKQAFEKAFAIASSHQAELTILDVIPELKISAGVAQDLGGKTLLQEGIAAARHDAIKNALASLSVNTAYTVKILTGRRYLEVIRTVLAEGHNLVVKLAEEPAWLGRFVSSDDMHLLRKCPCPVWLIQGGAATTTTGKVLAAIDFDPELSGQEQQALNEKILSFASSVALFEMAELHILHAWDSPIAGFASLWSDDPDEAEKQALDGEYRVRRDMIGQCEQWLRRKLGEEDFAYLNPHTRLLHGSPEEHIPAYAESIAADVVVMGTVGRTGVPGLIIGNTAEDVLQQLRCSVVAVKPDGFISPVTV